MMRTIRTRQFQNARTIALLALTVVLVACGGNHIRVLHMADSDYTEAQYRSMVVQAFGQGGIGPGLSQCQAIVRLKDADVFPFISGLARQSSFVPTVGVSDSDRLRAAQIIKDVCKQLLPKAP